MHIKVANLLARSVRYVEAGSGAPIILLHAFPLNAEQWLPQLSRLPPRVRAIAPDLRGFRGTEPFVGGESPDITMDTYARDVLELMSHLDVPRAVIAGSSMGGYVALALWRRAPNRVAGLVLANTRASADTAEARAGRDRLIQLVETEGAPGLAVALLPRLLGETTRREQPDLGDAVEQMIRANEGRGLQAAMRAMRDRPDSTELLASISCPTTIVAGAEDAVVPPAEADAMRGAIQGARLVVLPAAGHLSNLEAPVAFNDVLYSSIRRRATWTSN
ncbi:MAG: alpha/beta fold hydrolase [Acidobacteria bacterium]|nr:alpha/beta fold hydrolase [Acidobacteriota bacterium]